jgi:DtxR family transcriptional regulator, Mn-dependent transcriptional regulator
MAVDPLKENAISESLEDYLETVYHLVSEKQVARVKDIAKERKVSMASVTTAMHRLRDLDLIVYNQREFIQLTKRGEQVVRRIVTRHEIMRQFFTEFLQVDPEIANRDACQIEHHLSDETVDRLVRLLEYLASCHEGKRTLERFQNCHFVNPDKGNCTEVCERRRNENREQKQITTLGSLLPGAKAHVTNIQAHGAIRQRLIDMGMLPNTEVEVQRVAPSGDPIWIRVRGFNLSLRKHEANGIMVTPVT